MRCASTKCFRTAHDISADCPPEEVLRLEIWRLTERCAVLERKSQQFVSILRRIAHRSGAIVELSNDEMDLLGL